MNKLDRHEIKAKLEERRQHDREQIRQDAETMDALGAQAVQSLTEGMRVMVEEPEPRALEPSAETTPIDMTPAATADPRHAIEARRQRPASPSPAPKPGEPPLRAALRAIVQDYAEPVTPSERIATDLEASSGAALHAADTSRLWADLELGEVLAVQVAMHDVVDIVTDRAESIIIAELVAAQERLAREYPDVPRPNPADANGQES